MTLALVTGFGAFPGAPRNPTIAILDHLRKDHARRLARLGIALDLQILPVRFGDVEGALAGALTGAKPDLILHLGLAGRRRHLSVELRACNRLTGLKPDAGRSRARQTTIEPHGPALRLARWPAPRLVQALCVHAPTRLSRDAGDYVCNQTLYLTLARFAGPAGFLHVPPPRPDLPISAMARAVAAALVQLAVQHRVSTAGLAPAKA